MNRTISPARERVESPSALFVARFRSQTGVSSGNREVSFRPRHLAIIIASILGLRFASVPSTAIRRSFPSRERGVVRGYASEQERVVVNGIKSGDG